MRKKSCFDPSTLIYFGVVIIFCIFLAPISCDKNSTESDEIILINIELSPLTATLLGGQTQQFYCTANYSDRSSKRIKNEIIWATTPGTAGSINSQGLFISLNKAGVENVTALYQGKQAQAVVVVQGQQNTPPTAAFEVVPTSGTTNTDFKFNAIGCTDNEDSSSELKIRWDWESDGNWDEGFTTIKTSTHRYTNAGTKTIKLEVKDTGGLSDITTKQISVTSAIREFGFLTDIDSNVYKTIKIGNQWWMAENLKVTHYKNGDPIHNETSNGVWAALTSRGAYCNYENKESHVATYGRLYNWHAVNDVRGLAPKGWHVPTDEEWQLLTDYLGGASIAGGKLKERGNNHWFDPNTDATNESGFTGLPGGFRDSEEGYFTNMGYRGRFWSSTADWYTTALERVLLYEKASLWRISTQQKTGLSVRCVMDN